MAETLGSLCDKLTIIKLKQYHTEDKATIKSLNLQESQLVDEIDLFLNDAIKGVIPVQKLEFASNKIFKEEGNQVNDIKGKIGEVFSKLAEVNCDLWHEQEKVYDFEAILSEEKNNVVKKLALLNLERNKCIDSINQTLKEIVVENK